MQSILPGNPLGHRPPSPVWTKMVCAFAICCTAIQLSRSQSETTEADGRFDPREQLAPDSPLYQVLLAHPQGVEDGLRALKDPEVFRRELKAAEAITESSEGRIKREAGEPAETRAFRARAANTFEKVDEESRKAFSQASDVQRAACGVGESDGRDA